MATDIPTLQNVYIESCGRYGSLPNSGVLSCFRKAEVRKSCNELCSLDIFLDQLKDIDFPPLLDVCLSIVTSEIEAVDMYSGSSWALHGEYALTLMRAFSHKLRLVDLQDSLFGKDFLRDLLQGGLACQVLNLKSSRFRKLNMAGEFKQIHILNLDFSSLLTSFREDCFTCMPNLICLSMCATRVANLWTTVAAISKLSSLVELRFQKWVCCNDTGSSSALPGEKSEGHWEFGQLNYEAPSSNMSEHTDSTLATEETLRNMFSFNDVATYQEVQSMMQDPSDGSEVDFSSHWQENDYMDSFSNVSLGWNRQADLQDEVPFGITCYHNEELLPGSFTKCSADVALKYICCHASPICYEKHYREYIIASLPNLKTLDNWPIRKIDKEKATITYDTSSTYLTEGVIRRVLLAFYISAKSKKVGLRIIGLHRLE